MHSGSNVARPKIGIKTIKNFPTPKSPPFLGFCKLFGTQAGQFSHLFLIFPLTDSQ